MSNINDAYKEKLISILTDDLKMLRTKAGLTQQELASKLGVTRNLYAMIERSEHKMTWSNFLAFLLVFRSNPKTLRVIDLIGAYPPELENYLSMTGEEMAKSLTGIEKLSDDEMDFAAAAGENTKQEKKEIKS